MHGLLLNAVAILASLGLMAGSGAGSAPAPAASPDDGTPLLVEVPEETARTTVGACEYIKAGNSSQYQFWCGGVHFVFRGSEDDLADLLALLPGQTPEQIAALLKGEDAPVSIKHLNRYGPLSPGQLKKAEVAPVEDGEDVGTPAVESADKDKAQAPGQLKKAEQAPLVQGGNGNGGGNGGGKGGKK